MISNPHTRSLLKKKHTLPIAVVILVSSLLSACGFHLRGIYSVPSFLHEISLRTPDTSPALRTEVKIALETYHIQADGGEVLLDVVNENITRQTSTVDSSARAAEYTLIYTVNFRISRSDEKAIGEIQSLILRKSYQYNTSNIVGKNIEEENLVQELRRDAAQQIIRQFITLKAIPAIPEKASEQP